jgi:hypothetical protein
LDHQYCAQCLITKWEIEHAPSEKE